MQFLQSIRQKLNPLERRKPDPASLQVRLTLGMTAVSLLGVSGIGIWTTLTMQQMLVMNHKQYLWSIANRLPVDLADTTPQQATSQATSQVTPDQLQTALDRLSSPTIWLWVKQPDGRLLAESQNLANSPQSDPLMALSQMPTKPAVSFLDGRSFILCSTELQVQGQRVGQLYLAQDITHDYTVLTTLVHSLTVAIIIAIALILTLVTLMIRRSFAPLRKVNQLVSNGQLMNVMNAETWQSEEIPSEVKAIVSQLGHLSSQLSQAGERQQQFTHNISHELRTSLSLIYGYLQSTLRRSENLTTAQKEALEIATTETESTIRLLKDLLDLTRIHSGTLSLHLESIDLNSLVTCMVDRLVHDNVHPNIHIEAPEPVIAVADECKLFRTLQSLLDNATRYSAKHEPIVIKLSQTDHWAVIQVCDRGQGIAIEHQSKIFDPFYRVDDSRCRTTGGVGLGLATAKALIQAMGGTLSVQSQLGEGSTFTIQLPRRGVAG